MVQINDICELIEYAREVNASDIHMKCGAELKFRIHGKLVTPDIDIDDADKRDLIISMLNDDQWEKFKSGEDLDFSFQTPSELRCRVNVFKTKGSIGTVMRLLNSGVPSLENMGLPEVLGKMAMEPRGLILVTGPTGSGKSTTLAAMINEVNLKRSEHILTIEDPIEYIYEPIKSTITQREVGTDVKDFNTALKSALREDPDVILVGEMRDYETISLALTAAETGHLVMATLHTTSAPQTIDRIIDSCPPHAQEQVRTMLATTLKGIVTQCLVPVKGGGGRVAATEILLGTDAAMNLVRTNKIHQMDSVMQAGKALGMHTLNSNLAELVMRRKVEFADALDKCTDKDELRKLCPGFRE